MPDKVFPISRVKPPGLRSFYLLTAAVLAAPVAVGTVLVAWPTRLTFELAPAALTVRGSVYGRAVPAGSIVTSATTRLSAADLPAFQPRTRNNGVGLAHYKAGWFTLNSGRKALLFVTDWSRAVFVPTTEDYDLIVSPDDPDGFVSAVQGIASQGTTAPRVFLIAESAPDGWIGGMDLVFWLLLLGVPLTVLFLMALLLVKGRYVRFVVGEGALRVRGDLYGRTIPRQALRPADAEVIDLRASGRYGRMLRINGIGLPGYASGWFRPSGGGRALLFVTDRSRVVALPTTLGYTLLISPSDPADFLAALNTPSARLGG